MQEEKNTRQKSTTLRQGLIHTPFNIDKMEVSDTWVKFLGVILKAHSVSSLKRYCQALALHAPTNESKAQ